MAKKEHVSETQATQLLKANKVAFTEHPYEYLEHGGAMHSAEVLGLDPFTVVKTLVMQDPVSYTHLDVYKRQVCSRPGRRAPRLRCQ